MVKRVVDRATWGSCRDPEAVSWSRNKTGDKGFTWDILPELVYDFQNILCLEPYFSEFAESPANFIVFALDAISLECLGSRAYFY